MNNCGVFKIIFDHSTIELNEIYNKLIKLDKDIINSLTTESYFDYENNNKYSCIVITTYIELKKYLNILSKNEIKYNFIDLSEKILNSNYDIFEGLNKEINTLNLIKWSFFIEDLDRWIYENLEIDTILDRISKVGMKNLSKIEKKFLKNKE